MPMSTELVDAEALRNWPLPTGTGSKYERGQVLVAGGSAHSAGAAILAGTAALRVGAGRLTLAVAGSVAAQSAISIRIQMSATWLPLPSLPSMARPKA